MKYSTTFSNIAYNCLEDKSFHVELSKCKISKENVKENLKHGMFESAASYFMDRNKRVEKQNGKKGEKIELEGNVQRQSGPLQTGCLG